MSDLKLSWATHAQAEYACRRWHYSRCVPKSKLVKIGVWESGKFIGVVIFSCGANNRIGGPYGLEQDEVCELTRVALSSHEAPVSRIVSIALKMLKKICPGVRLIVSYADLERDHHGGIYQAGNWIYEGQIKPCRQIVLFGVRTHTKSIHCRYGKNSLKWIQENVDPSATVVMDVGKHKYIMPIDKSLRGVLSSRALPYPKRNAPEAEATKHLSTRRDVGGSSPTSALHSLIEPEILSV